MNFKKILVEKERLLLGLLILMSAGLYFFVSYTKHKHFQTFGWDTSVFDQQAYLVSRLKRPISSLHGMHILGDHFQVTFMILGGLGYRIWKNAAVLFLLQAMMACLSAIPLYLITKLLLDKTCLEKSGKVGMGLIICGLYLFSVSFQGMVLDEFHNEPLVVLPLLLLVYFLLKDSNYGYWLSFIWVLLTKEIFGLLGIPLGIWIYILKRDLKKAMLTAIVGVGVFSVLVFKIMPMISGSENYYHFTKGNNPKYLLDKFSDNPSLLITELVNHDEKQKTIGSSLISFGFLPLLSLESLIVPIFSLAIRFYDDTSERLYEFNNHYAAPFLPLLAVAASGGLYQLIKVFNKKKVEVNKLWPILAGCLMGMGLGQTVVFHGPLNSIIKGQFYETYEWEKNAYELIKQVPADEVIATQNSLLPHLSAREHFYLLPEYEGAEYIAVDLVDGPNKFSPATKEEIEKLIDDVVENGDYEIVWQKNQAILLKRGD